MAIIGIWAIPCGPATTGEFYEGQDKRYGILKSSEICENADSKPFFHNTYLWNLSVAFQLSKGSQGKGRGLH